MEKSLSEKQTLSEDAVTYSKQLLSLCISDCAAGTLFLGDSFFDIRYFCEGFQEQYAGKNAVAAGIGGATTYDWQQLAPRFFPKVSPKNLVVNLGTNNFYDDHDALEEAIQNLQALFSQLHGLLPETQIYYFSIVHREDPCYSREIDAANAALKNWCEGKEWMHFLDIVNEMPAFALRDGVHPKPESYPIFWEKLSASGIEIAEKHKEPKS